MQVQGQFHQETEDLRDDVSENAKLADAAVLERRNGEFYCTQGLA